MLYFSYGSNMDPAAMAKRCPRSKPLGLAKLMRHRVAIMREGWLTVVRDARSTVHGVLWDLALADVPALDRYEGALYVKATQPVIAAGGPKRAMVYFGANAGPGRADAAYIAGVIEAARGWDLPAEAMAQFARLAAEAGVSVAPPSPPPGVRPRYQTPFDR